MASKLLNKACFWRGRKLDKKPVVAKWPGFAHSLLWIFMGLSTEQDGLVLAGMVEAGSSDAAMAWPESEIFFGQGNVRQDRIVCQAWRSKSDGQSGRVLVEVENFFFGQGRLLKRVLRFTPKSLYTE